MSISFGEILDLQKKRSNELLSFLYGGLIVRLYKDLKDPEEINKKTEEIGFNIGQRLIDDILVNLGKLPEKPKSFFVDKILNQIFTNFLGISDHKLNKKTDTEFEITFKNNSLNTYVELPDSLKSLWYSNIICGIIRGAFLIVNVDVQCQFVKDILKGDDINCISFVVKQYIEEKFADDDD